MITFGIFAQGSESHYDCQNLLSENPWFSFDTYEITCRLFIIISSEI